MVISEISSLWPLRHAGAPLGEGREKGRYSLYRGVWCNLFQLLTALHLPPPPQTYDDPNRIRSLRFPVLMITFFFCSSYHHINFPSLLHSHIRTHARTLVCECVQWAGRHGVVVCVWKHVLIGDKISSPKSDCVPVSGRKKPWAHKLDLGSVHVASKLFSFRSPALGLLLLCLCVCVR